MVSRSLVLSSSGSQASHRPVKPSKANKSYMWQVTWTNSSSVERPARRWVKTKNFPTVGETLHTCSSTEPDTARNATDTPHSDSDTHAAESATGSPCTSQHRRTPPPKPTEISFPATENNWMNLQQWLLDYYQTSTFNTCEHQPLPLMESIPMRLMVDPSAEPATHHTPILVPLHWQEDVKAGLNQDISLGMPWTSTGRRACHMVATAWSSAQKRTASPTAQSTSNT